MPDLLRERLPRFAAALWWGSLTALSFIVVPLLFAHLPSPAMAGGMAARLFTAQTWVGVVCGLLILASLRSNQPMVSTGASSVATIFIVGGMLLALLAEFAVAPRIIARENIKLWHAVGSAMYLVQWVCSGVVLWRLTGKASRD